MPKRYLVVARHLLYLRIYEQLIRDLSAGGDEVVIALERDDDRYRTPVLLGLDDLPGVRIEAAPRPVGAATAGVLALRSLRNYFRYLEPAFRGTDAVRYRAERRVLSIVVTVFGRSAGRPSRLRAAIDRIALVADNRTVAHPSVRRYVETTAPDAVMVTPYVDLNSTSADFVKAARALGIPTAHLVASWDNLTNKGVIPVLPDRLIVWNEAQVDEAVELHGVPRAHVITTGAQVFDEWFERQADRDEGFLRSLGADPDRRTILYVCSSVFIARHEHRFIEEWARSIRASDDVELRRSNLIVRPHPAARRTHWRRWKANIGLIVWPPDGDHVIGRSERDDYVRQITSADVVVGLNTSAILEAAILGRPVLTVLDPRFESVQRGTLHLRHLLDGLLEAADDLDGHVRQLQAHLADADLGREARARFLESFVRPHGIDEPAQPHLERAVRALPQVEALPMPEPRTAVALGVATIGLLQQAIPGWVRARRKRREILTREGDEWSRRRRSVARQKGLRRLRRRAVRSAGVVTRALGVHEQALKVVGYAETRAVRIATDVGDRPIERLVDHLRAADGPIVFGPWFGEVGFEILYWVPFLRWLHEAHDLDTSQWHVVSRGGTRSWYGDAANGGYADALSVMSAEEFRLANASRWLEVGSQKQRYESHAEARLLKQLQGADRLPADFELVHPSVMYEYFWLAWKRKIADDRVRRSTRYARVAAPDLPAGLDLPERFIVAKWYFRPSLTDEPVNVNRIRRLTNALAAHAPVVLLHDNPVLDDHVEAALGTIPDVHTVLGDVAPDRNLEVQSAVIARAEHYVGTYGGLGYVPMLYGVPSLLFASDMRPLRSVHVRAGHDAALELGASHSLLDLGVLDLLAPGQGSSRSAG